MKSRLYIMNTRTLEISPRLVSALPEYRRAAVERFVFEKDKRLSVGAGLLLKRACEEWGISGEDEHIIRLDCDKPVFERCPEVHFNLSHSGEMAVCAISECSIGCDIETVGPFREKLAKKVCSDAEYEYLSSLEDEKKAGEFIRLWTLKESYMKLTGDGLSALADSIGFTLTPRVQLVGHPELSFFEYGVGRDYRCSVCTEDTNRPEVTVYAP